jgi:hypothetical protein
MAKRSTKRASAKRDTVRSRTVTMYAKRDDAGQFRDMDETRRSQRADRPRKATKRVASGFGDQGDRRAIKSAKRPTTRGSARATAKSRRGGSVRAKKKR